MTPTQLPGSRALQLPTHYAAGPFGQKGLIVFRNARAERSN